MLGRRGFSLVEIAIALVLTGVVTAILVGTLLNALAVASFQTQRMAVLRTLRYGTTFLTTELQGASPPAGDLIAIGGSGVRYRAARGLAVVCMVGADWLAVRHRFRYALRAWAPGRDSLLMLFSTDVSGGVVHRWVATPLRAVSGTGVRCPDGSPATRLTTTFPASVPSADLRVGNPVRLFETMEIRLYPSQGAFWLGLRSLSGGGTIQPTLGPFTGTGLRLQFVDRLGRSTTDPRSVASVRATLTARSPRMTRRRWPGPLDWVDDSVTFAFTVRGS